MSSNPISLGSTVKCAVSGVQGFVVTCTETFNGNLRYGVQPSSEDGKSMPDAWDIDHQTLDVIDEGISSRAIPAPENTIEVGMLVRDILSDYVGTVASKTTHLNGCIYCLVVPKINPKSLLSDAPAGTHIAVERLVKDGEGVLAARKQVSTPELRTGGPSTRSIRF